MAFLAQILQSIILHLHEQDIVQSKKSLTVMCSRRSLFVCTVVMCKWFAHGWWEKRKIALYDLEHHLHSEMWQYPSPAHNCLTHSSWEGNTFQQSWLQQHLLVYKTGLEHTLWHPSKQHILARGQSLSVLHSFFTGATHLSGLGRGGHFRGLPTEQQWFTHSRNDKINSI